MISGCFHEFYILTSNISNNIQLLSNYHLALTSLKTRLIHSILNMNGKKVLTYGTNNRELVVAIYSVFLLKGPFVFLIHKRADRLFGLFYVLAREQPSLYAN